MSNLSFSTPDDLQFKQQNVFHKSAKTHEKQNTNKKNPCSTRSWANTASMSFFLGPHKLCYQLLSAILPIFSGHKLRSRICFSNSISSQKLPPSYFRHVRILSPPKKKTCHGSRDTRKYLLEKNTKSHPTWLRNLAKPWTLDGFGYTYINRKYIFIYIIYVGRYIYI